MTNLDTVFQKTRELAQALIECEPYQSMREAEDRMQKNPEASQTMSQYLEKRAQLEKLVSSDDFDAGEMKRVSNELDELQTRLQLMDDVANVSRARNDFSQVMGQVNQVLQFMITGQMDDGECGGSCASCGGCARKN